MTINAILKRFSVPAISGRDSVYVSLSKEITKVILNTTKAERGGVKIANFWTKLRT